MLDSLQDSHAIITGSRIAREVIQLELMLLPYPAPVPVVPELLISFNAGGVHKGMQ